MAYVVWRVLLNKYSKVRLGIHRNNSNASIAPAAVAPQHPQPANNSCQGDGQPQHDTSDTAHFSQATSAPSESTQQPAADTTAAQRQHPEPEDDAMSRSSATAASPETVIAVDNDEEECVPVSAASDEPSRDGGEIIDGESAAAVVLPSTHMIESSSSTFGNGHPHCGLSARSVSEPVVMTVYPSSAYHQKVPQASSGTAVRRTQSKVRMFLKRYRDALIGSSSSRSDHGCRNAAVNGNGRGRSRSTVSVCPITHHEAIEQRSSCTSWYVDETTIDDGVKTLSVAGAACAETEEDQDVSDRTEDDRVAEMDCPIDLAANIVACQSGSSDAAVAGVVGDGVDYGCEDQLSQSSADTVLDMEALMVHSDRLIDAEQQQQQQQQRQQHHQRSHSDGTEASGIAQLVDRYLGDLYADYGGHTRAVLVRQARDMLVCTFYGDLQRFEREFLGPAAQMLRQVYGSHRRSCRRCDSSGPPGGQATLPPCPSNWPLTYRQAVVLHLGQLDESLLRPGDVYLCLRPATNGSIPHDQIAGPASNPTSTAFAHVQPPPELCATWRYTSVGGVTSVQQRRISAAATTAQTGVTPLTLEMLAEELPHLLQSLLVGVEHAINRVPLDELSVFHPSESLALSQPPPSSVRHADSTASSVGPGSAAHSKLLLSPLGSPKCGLKRREMINKSKLSNKYALKRMASKTESTTSSPPTTTADPDDFEVTASLAAEPPLSNLPLFCLGRSFPHIDSDEESSDDTSTIKPDSEVRLPQDVVAPRSILDLSEKLLLTSGIYLPGTRDIKGASIITVEAGPLLRSGVNCYEIATVLLYYSTIPVNTTFMLHTIATEPADMSALDLLDASLHLLAGNITVSHLLVSCANTTTTQPNTTDERQPRVRQLPASQTPVTYTTGIAALLAHIAAGQVPVACGGPRRHCQRRWRDFFVALEPLKSQCLAAGRRLVSVMGEIRASDHQGVPSRRQLFAQHRALSRALMDPDLQNLRRKGQANLQRLRELQTAIRAESGDGGDGKVASECEDVKTPTLSPSDAGGQAAAAAATAASVDDDVCVRLNEVITIFEEVDRAARRLEQLTEQRRERLRELTRQRTLEDEINELDAWIRDDGDVALAKFAKVPLECETLIKDHEQEFEKFYFVSMKHLTKGQDLQNACVDIANLLEPSRKVRAHLAAFGERLERTRERIEGAARLHHLLGLRLKDDDGIQQEMERLAHKIGVPGLVEMCRRNSAIGKSAVTTKAAVGETLAVDGGARPLCTSTPNAASRTDRLSEQTDRKDAVAVADDSTDYVASSIELAENSQQQQPDAGCHCWRDSQQTSSSTAGDAAAAVATQNLKTESVANAKAIMASNFQSNRSSSDDEENDDDEDDDDDEYDFDDDDDEGEEDHSKMADSGLGYCERCEGQGKMTRACSCQSFDDPTNTSSKSNHSNDLEEECFEGNLKQMLDFQSPLQPNAHLYCYSSSMDLPELDNTNGLDPKTQKTLLFIMREMIGTERDYVRSLRYIIDHYTDELNREDIPQAMRGQRNVIFGNVEKICEFHQQHFLRELEQYEQHPLKVGAAFLAHEAKFYLYALYNKNKPKSDSLMSEYGSRFFKTKQIELDDKMDLASYLLKPVQRMGKYALLLQQLMKAVTSVQGPSLQKISEDIEELQRAEEMVRFQLRHGNDLLAMDSLRDCDVNVKEQGRLLRQNEFLVWQGRGGKKALRQVFLFEELVLFSKARRFPDRKNLDIYLYKNSIKTSDIGLTACADDESPNKFEIWFRKRKPEDTWTLQCISEDVKNAWTEEVTKLLWSQARRNREVRLAEMSSMGIGNKPCLDIRPSGNQISDRSITISQLEKTPKFRNSFSGTLPEVKATRRPNSIISLGSSFSSGTSRSSLSTSASSSGSLSARCKTGLELIRESSPPLQTSTMYGRSKHHHQRSTTLISQLSMESGTIADMSTSPESDGNDDHHNPLAWPTCMQIKHTSSSLSTSSSTTSSTSSSANSTTSKCNAATTTTTLTDAHNNHKQMPQQQHLHNSSNSSSSSRRSKLTSHKKRPAKTAAAATTSVVVDSAAVPSLLLETSSSSVAGATMNEA